MSWYYWLIILGVLIIFYVMLIVRQKKQEKQSVEILNSFQVGDRVVTHIGIYGKIKRIYNTTYGKICILEIGEKNKVDVEMDMRYIAAKDEKTEEPEVLANENLEQNLEQPIEEEKGAEVTPKQKTKQKTKKTTK